MRQRKGEHSGRRGRAIMLESKKLEGEAYAMNAAIDLLGQVESMKQKAVASGRLRPSGSRGTATARQLQLWPNHMRGLPNSLARCALFTAGNPREERRMYEDEIIISLQGTAVRYTGRELRQDDQDVFLQIVHSARVLSMGDGFIVTGHSLLTALGWGRGEKKYARLRDSIKRLVGGTVWVSVEDGKAGYSGRLIDKVKWKDESSDGKNAKWQFRLDPDIIGLFGGDAFSLIDWEQRLSLAPLEKWLHSFYLTHRAPFPYKVETLYQLCGSRCRLLRQFKYMLKGALENLVAAGFLESFSIDAQSGLVSVTRKNLKLERA